MITCPTITCLRLNFIAFRCYKGKIGDREATLIAALRTKLQQQVDRGDSVKDYKVASMFRVWYNLRKTEGKITSNMSFRGPTILVFLGFLSCVHADLKLGFYDDSCPKAEKLILDFVEEHIPNAPTVAASLLRMHFHDCFVRVRCNAFISTHSCFLHGMFDAILRVVMALCSSIQPAPTKLRRPRLRTKHSAGSTSSIA